MITKVGRLHYICFPYLLHSFAEFPVLQRFVQHMHRRHWKSQMEYLCFSHPVCPYLICFYLHNVPCFFRGLLFNCSDKMYVGRYRTFHYFLYNRKTDYRHSNQFSLFSLYLLCTIKYYSSLPNSDSIPLSDFSGTSNSARFVRTTS